MSFHEPVPDYFEYTVIKYDVVQEDETLDLPLRMRLHLIDDETASHHGFIETVDITSWDMSKMSEKRYDAKGGDPSLSPEERDDVMITILSERTRSRIGSRSIGTCVWIPVATE